MCVCGRATSADGDGGKDPKGGAETPAELLALDDALGQAEDEGVDEKGKAEGRAAAAAAAAEGARRRAVDAHAWRTSSMVVVAHE